MDAGTSKVANRSMMRRDMFATLPMFCPDAPADVSEDAHAYPGKEECLSWSITTIM